jgi:hypothetical protein
MSNSPAIKLTPQASRLLKELAVESRAVGPRGLAVNELRRAGFVEWDGQSTETLWWVAITRAGKEYVSHAQ